MKNSGLLISVAKVRLKSLLNHCSLLGLAALAFMTTAAIAQTSASGGATHNAPAHPTNAPRIAVVPINTGIQERGEPLDNASAGSSSSVQIGPVGNAILTGNGIEYHNGSIFASTPNVYFIWYGNWNGNTATSILPRFISDLNHTQYFNTNTTYGTERTDPSGSGAILSQSNMVNTIAFGGQIFDSYSQGTTLNDSSVKAVVNRALSNGLPTDGNGIYLVLTSADVNVTSGNQSFCNNFCGYHTFAQLHSTSIKFGFVGNSARCISSCAASFIGLGPNGNAGADGMANVIAHEINETVTDPDANTGWYHINTLGEVGDLCNFHFGSTFGTAPNGAPFNVTFNGRHYLIQQNFLNLGGGSCALAYSTPNGTPAAGKVSVTGAVGCQDGGCEFGQVQMQLIMPSRTVTETVFYDGTGVNGPADAQGVANALASAFNNDPNANSLVTATVSLGNPYWAPSGNTIYWITFRTTQNGASLNANQWNISIAPLSSPFPNTTLSLTPTVSSMVGGADPCCTF